MTKHAGISSSHTQPIEPRVTFEHLAFCLYELPLHLSPSLSRLLHRQHEHRHWNHRRSGRLHRPGFSHDAPLHEEPSFRKTPPISQRYKQILQLSWSDTRALDLVVKNLTPNSDCTGSGLCCCIHSLCFTLCHANVSVLEFLIYVIITNFGDTFQVVLLS